MPRKIVNGKVVHLPYGPAKPAGKPAMPRAVPTRGKPATPGSQRNATASARNKGQRGSQMRKAR